MSNVLSPGNGGLAAGSPDDQKARPPGAPAPTPAPHPKQQQLLDQEDQLAHQFLMLKEGQRQMQIMRQQLDKLVAMGDTVTQDAVVDATAAMVAAGAPAIKMATTLADMPEGTEALQAWVEQHSQALQPAEQKLSQALSQTRHKLGQAAMKNIIVHSANQFHTGQAQRRLLATTVLSGRPN